MRIIFQQFQDLACLSVCAAWLNFKEVPSSSFTITVLRSSNDIGPQTWCNRRRMWNAALLLGCTAHSF
ncbi:hypothetical protein TNCV_55431 [Trichonephila clavipes]|nr:hypothetical protein TNCV_55431 [Trichonephila clavipes]